MKFTRKLIPAVAMLVVSATMMSTASFAWFSMNRTVTATGMQATAVSPINLLIKGADDTDFATSATVTSSNPTLPLTPMSTVNPVDPATFYAVVDGVINNGAGGKVEANGEGTFVTATNSSTVMYYVDYQFDLKLSSDVPSDVPDKTKTIEAYLSSLTISGTSELNNAVRVAVLEGNTLKGIYGVEATDAVTGSAAKAIKTVDGSQKCTEVAEVLTVAVNDESDYSYNANNAFVVTATAKTITVRVWIEGQDDDCKNENAGKTFNISLKFAVK